MSLILVLLVVRKYIETHINMLFVVVVVAVVVGMHIVEYDRLCVNETSRLRSMKQP
jgi:hypothetical protein